MPDKEAEEARKAETTSRGTEDRGLAAPDMAKGVPIAAGEKPVKKRKKGLWYLGDADTNPDPYVSKTSEYPRLVLVRRGGPAFVQRCDYSKKRRGEFTRPREGESAPNGRYVYYCNSDNIRYYYNKGKGPGTASPVHGYRSKLIVELGADRQKSFDAIERADGFTHLKPTDSSRIYVVAMRKTKHHARPLVVTGLGSVLIHPARYASDLDGCIAPGTAPDEENGGILNSEEALEEIIQLLGGWPTKGENPVRLLVRGEKNIPG